MHGSIGINPREHSLKTKQEQQVVPVHLILLNRSVISVHKVMAKLSLPAQRKMC